MEEFNFLDLRKAAQNKNVKKVAMAMSLTLIGVTAAAATAAVMGYNAFFNRYERPDYALYPGMYHYDRFEGSLPRETLTVPSKNADLAAYYYPVEDPKGLVVVVHGIHAGADDYLPLIEALTKGGYAVFAYDVTGNYSSGGTDGVGMCQQLVDLDNVLSWLAANQPYANMPKMLIGHSWGGYAVSSVLALHQEVKACVCIAPMRDGTTIMSEKAEQYAGEVADNIQPVFGLYQKYLFDDYTKYNAIVGINSTDIPVLIAQGVEDTTITYDGSSITACLDQITNPNVAVYYTTGLQGSHTGIWHSVEAEEYVRQVDAQLKRLEDQKGDKLTDEEKAEFYKTVDHRLYSDVNPELMDRIFQTFEKGLEK